MTPSYYEADTERTPSLRGVRTTINPYRHLLGAYTVLGALIAAACAVSPTFRTPLNVFNVLRQAVSLGFTSLGQTFVMIAGGIDLSVGAMISLASVLTAGLMQGRPDRLVWVVLLMLGLGGFVGLFNGWVVTRLRVPAFVATLGMMSVLQGFVLSYAKQPVGSISPDFHYLAEGYIGWVPVPVILLALVYIAGWLALSMTPFGQYVYAVGGGEEHARVSGIHVGAVKVSAYVISSVSAVLSGLFLTSRMGVGDPLVGTGYELDSIAAALLGGTALSGGRGSLWGTLAGAVIMTVLSNLLNLLNVSTFWQWIVKGVIIIVVVGVLRETRVER